MNLTRIGAIVLAVVAAVAASFALFRAIDERAAPPIVIEDLAATVPIVVDVRGAVLNPGVYELPPQARVHDAILAGGGLGDRADLSTLNLARRLRDGEVVVVADEVEFLAEARATGSAPSDPFSGTPDRRVNINTATISDLDVLPGIGEVTAERVIAYRNENGPFRSIDDLVHVDGISTRTIEELRDLVTTSP